MASTEEVIVSASEGTSAVKKTLTTILNQYKENIKVFSLSLPSALILIPLSLFILSPTASRGIFLFGAIVTSVIALIFTPVGNPDNFMSNYPSFSGMALGYVVGYLLMENIMLSKLGSMLATSVMGLILSIILCLILYSEEKVFDEMLNVGLGLFLGMAVGASFSYAEFKNNQKEETIKKENHKIIVNN